MACPRVLLQEGGREGKAKGEREREVWCSLYVVAGLGGGGGCGDGGGSGGDGCGGDGCGGDD